MGEVGKIGIFCLRLATDLNRSIALQVALIAASPVERVPQKKMLRNADLQTSYLVPVLTGLHLSIIWHHRHLRPPPNLPRLLIGLANFQRENSLPV